MTTSSSFKNPAIVLALATIALTVYMGLFLHAETQLGVAVLLITAVIATILSRRTGATQQLEQSAARRPGLARLWALGGILALIAVFYNEHFVLLMICSVLLYTTACLGLTLQFGFSGVANFAGAAFLASAVTPRR
ncbi:hypothetical protein [Actimicrobium sp. CCI2.3]|uniref:hypothetical protein n=1 Tax=Actimicrobium sp. CCI2.3 TaxID=3048616 RepID=UPI003A0FDD28